MQMACKHTAGSASCCVGLDFFSFSIGHPAA